MVDAARTNPRLARQGSAYLSGAAHQPVDWHPWGAEAFERARRENKPVLLDVGAVWCHWCHVMDDESYEDPELARLINERFVPIKVDRDERPDVDARYQRRVAALSGQGGWPLTAFLTPDGTVFYGGTYFPPEERYGRPSFRTILAAVADAYRDRNAEVVRQADAIESALAHDPSPARGTPAGAARVPVEGAVDELLLHQDPVHGGWGDAPKFPHPSGIEFLLGAYERAPREDVASFLRTTLERMSQGGVYDQVGGGFHRYSIDAEWHVPHFEKMLYDNAELLRNYVYAWKVLRDDAFARTATDMVRFLDEVLSDRERGGFYGSQDADAGPDDDGDYFTWTPDEVGAAAGRDDALARLLRLRYGIQARGPLHHNPQKNVLWAAAEPEDLAATLHLPLESVERELEHGLARLRAARARRPAPFVDPVCYTNWNAMAIRAYLEFAGAFERPAARDFALRTLGRFLAQAYRPDAGFAHALGGRPVAGLLDDQAQMLPTLCVAFNHTQDPTYLTRAREIAALLEREFWDEQEGGFLDLARTLHPREPVRTWAVPERPVQDAPSPSANARAAEGLLLLHQLTGEAEHAKRVERMAAALGPEARRVGLFGAAFLKVLHDAADPPAKIVIAGPAGDPHVAGLHRVALRRASPATAVRVVASDGDLDGLPAEAAAFARGPGRTRAGAVVCRGPQCLAPVFEPAALEALLQKPPRAGARRAARSPR